MWASVEFAPVPDKLWQTTRPWRLLLTWPDWRRRGKWETIGNCCVGHYTASAIADIDGFEMRWFCNMIISFDMTGYSCRLHPWASCQQEKSGGGNVCCILTVIQSKEYYLPSCVGQEDHKTEKVKAAVRWCPLWATWEARSLLCWVILPWKKLSSDSGWIFRW